jgi:hypothetical protein
MIDLAARRQIARRILDAVRGLLACESPGDGGEPPA